MYKKLIDKLLKSEEPSIKYKVRLQILNENPKSPTLKSLQEEIKNSTRVKKLLSNRDSIGRLEPVDNPYHKWFGAHWVLSHLAEIDYPKEDKALLPIRDQVYCFWLRDKMFKLVECTNRSQVNKANGVPVLKGRARRCASQQGNALYSTLKLGIEDKRAETLASLLLMWQWPDGGWNCDKNPDAHVSSFMESLIPLRALSLYSQKNGENVEIEAAVNRAAEVFLSRNMFRSIKDGKVIHPKFLEFHYPCYWHYDILFGLKVMAEAGFIHDYRCKEALDILQEKALPEGGWSAQGRYYKAHYENSIPSKLNYDKVSWGTVHKRKINEWVTTDALYVLTQAKRINI